MTVFVLIGLYSDSCRTIIRKIKQKIKTKYLEIC